MTRGLSAAAKAYTGPIFWLADITALDGSEYHYWTGEGSRVINAITYQPYLRIPSGFRHTRSLQVDSGAIEFDAIDGTILGVLAADTFQGALCVVQQYMFSIDTLAYIMRGRLSEQERRIDAVAYQLKAEFEPGEIQALGMEYSALCRHRFAKPPCGYTNASIAVTENLAEQTADIFSASTIGLTTLTMTVNEHADREVLITAGTGKGQHRRIISNTATTISLYQDWSTTPDGTSKFRVVMAAYGLPKQLYTATSAVDIATADVHTTRTIGLSTLAMATDEHSIDGEDEVAAVVRIFAGTGSGQEKRIGSNTATTITIGSTESDFSPEPDATSQFRVLYGKCPKDIASACEQRARTHRFCGAPTVSPELSRIYNPTVGVTAGGDSGGGGGGGGEEGGNGRLAT